MLLLFTSEIPSACLELCYFYKQYILGQPQEVASILAKLSAGATFVNAIVSTILVVIIYNAVRPALIKANLIHVYVTAANAK